MIPTPHRLMISLLFILLSVYIKCAAAQDPAPVLDIDGKQVRAGVKYYVLPVMRGRGGGLTLASTGNRTCLLGVVQEAFELQMGLPLTFSPVDKKGLVRVSTDQNIEFSAVSTRPQSTVWKLDNYDESTGKYFITTGGVLGNPGGETISNWFKIEAYGNDYKLVFCPTVCNYCKVMCRDIGIFFQDGKRRLALTDDAPFGVIFKKA